MDITNENKDHSKRTQRDYSSAFKLQVVEMKLKRLFSLEAKSKEVGHSGAQYCFGMVKKTWNFGLDKQSSHEKQAPPKLYISQLEARIKRLEADKKILNQAIDIADHTWA